MQDFRRIRAWKKSHALALRVRDATHRFPGSGYSRLKLQMTDAAESIPFNIVEGSGSDSQKEFARFLAISIKSAGELQYQLMLAADYRVLARPEFEELTAETIDTRKMICGLRKKVLATLEPPKADREQDNDKQATSNDERKTR